RREACRAARAVQEAGARRGCDRHEETRERGVKALAAAGRLRSRCTANAAIGERLYLEARERDLLPAIRADSVSIVLDLVEGLRDLRELEARLVAERVDDLGVLELLRLLLRVGAAAAAQILLEVLETDGQLPLLREQDFTDLGIRVHRDRLYLGC